MGTKAIRRVLVSEADLKNAYWSVMTGNGGAYIRSLFDVEGIQFQTIRETTKLAEDLELFIQASHHPGRHRYGAENRPPRHHPHHQ